MPTLYLVRHGETAWNAAWRFMGSSDIPLNERGEQQAQTLLKRLAGETYAAIYASDLGRVRQTVGFALDGHAQLDSVVYDARLREIDFGQWEGLTWDEIASQHPADLSAWQTQGEANGHGGESTGDVTRRVNAFLADVQRQHSEEERILLFAHGGTFAILLCSLLGIDPLKWLQFRFVNCAMSEISITTRYGVVLRKLNDTAHLD